MFLFQTGNVIQFNENHKWGGCFGTIVEVKTYDDGSIRYMIEVPHIVSDGDGSHVYPAYIFVSDKENAIEYVSNQREHHKKMSFHDEYLRFLKLYNVDYDERYIFRLSFCPFRA